MEARIFRAALLALVVFASLGARYKTANFIVTASTPEIATQVGDLAERYRKELAIEWTGNELPRWAEPCPITVKTAPNLGAGGATSFLFDRGEVYGWRMNIQGSLERVLDSVLPHEVTHTIFASHFRQPLPRWADEGACTTVEHVSEKKKQEQFLIQFLKTGRGIPFSRMFVMKEYPPDVMPLYSQGYSLARYLIAQGGKRKYLDYLSDGLKNEHWTAVTKKHYGFENLGQLQNDWLDWVRQGSPPLAPEDKSDATISVASAQRRPRPEPNLIYRGQSEDPEPAPAAKLVPVVPARSAAVAPPWQSTTAIEPQIPTPQPGQNQPPRVEFPQSLPPASPPGYSLTAGAAPDVAPPSSQPRAPIPERAPGRVLLEWHRPTPE